MVELSSVMSRIAWNVKCIKIISYELIREPLKEFEQRIVN